VETKRTRGAGWLNDGSRAQNMQTASTRPCDSENRTDRNPIEDRRTSGLKSPRELKPAAATDTIDYVTPDQSSLTSTTTTPRQ
jgi:hypothetical protein